MGQIGTIRVDTQSNGTVSVPVFNTGDSGSDIYEFVRVQTAGGTGFIPVVDTGSASFPYLRVQSQNQGVVAIHNEASLPDFYLLDDFADNKLTNRDTKQQTASEFNSTAGIFRPNWTSGGEFGDFFFSVGATNSRLRVRYNGEGFNHRGGATINNTIDTTNWSGGVLDVEFFDFSFTKNSSRENNRIWVGMSDAAYDERWDDQANFTVAYIHRQDGAVTGLIVVNNGTETITAPDSKIDWSSNHKITVRLDDTGESLTAELFVDNESSPRATDSNNPVQTTYNVGMGGDDDGNNENPETIETAGVRINRP